MPWPGDLAAPFSDGHLEAIGDAVGLLHDGGDSGQRAALGNRLLEQREQRIEVRRFDRQRKVSLHRLAVVSARKQDPPRPKCAQLGQELVPVGHPSEFRRQQRTPVDTFIERIHEFSDQSISNAAAYDISSPRAAPTSAFS